MDVLNAAIDISTFSNSRCVGISPRQTEELSHESLCIDSGNSSTVPDPKSDPAPANTVQSRHRNVALIVGLIVAACVVIILILLLVVCLRRRKQSANGEPGYADTDLFNSEEDAGGINSPSTEPVTIRPYTLSETLPDPPRLRDPGEKRGSSAYTSGSYERSSTPDTSLGLVIPPSRQFKREFLQTDRSVATSQDVSSLGGSGPGEVEPSTVGSNPDDPSVIPELLNRLNRAIANLPLGGLRAAGETEEPPEYFENSRRV